MILEGGRGHSVVDRAMDDVSDGKGEGEGDTRGDFAAGLDRVEQRRCSACVRESSCSAKIRLVRQHTVWRWDGPYLFCAYDTVVHCAA